MLNSLSQIMWTWDIALVYGLLMALAVVSVIIFGFRGLSNAGIKFPEQVRLWIAGAGYWGTLACSIFCLISHSSASTLVSAALPVVQTAAPVPPASSSVAPVTLRGGHFVPAEDH